MTKYRLFTWVLSIEFLFEVDFSVWAFAVGYDRENRMLGISLGPIAVGVAQL
jgi:hypothetical protein